MADIIRILEGEQEKQGLPIVSQLAVEHRDPFEILISTILSLRTKDEVTAVATERLFALAATPEEMLRLSPEEIQRAIYPVGFLPEQGGDDTPRLPGIDRAVFNRGSLIRSRRS